MFFSVFVPPQARERCVPAVYVLPDVACDEETFMVQAGAQRVAAQLGLALVACDTSPRGLCYPGESGHWDFGVGAGYYVDAAREPWVFGYQMGRYVDEELPLVVERHFPVLPTARGILGHSMGGHGALITALRSPDRWQSVSALAPISNPMRSPWGRKAFSNFLGSDCNAWKKWDACELMRNRRYPGCILVDQGEADLLLTSQLHPDALERAALESGQALVLRRHAGYDHGYHFVQSFIADHLRHHAAELSR